MCHRLLQVAVPSPLYQPFDYWCPDDCLVADALPPIGGRVLVPFGHQKLIAIVIAHPSHSDLDPSKLKPILRAIDDQAIFDKRLLDLAYWLSAYYHYPLGETFDVMMPALLKQGTPITHHVHTWTISEQARDEQFVQTHIKTSAKKQRADFLYILTHPHSTHSTLRQAGISDKNLKLLTQKGLIVCHAQTPTPPKTATLNEPHLTLNDEQQSALDAINRAIDTGYQGILLNGITGSGKTEVYLHAIDHALQNNKQVLVLIPEIGLTPQSQARFAKRFCANIVVLHSRLNNKERLQGWQDCQSGHAQIIIATRSGLFYPFKALGLIVIDEAHDNSFKQQDHLRYHACDVALYLGFCQNIPVVLGSATPSLEQLKLVMDNKLKQYILTQRAGGGSLGKFVLVDMRLGTQMQTDITGQWVDSELSATTIDAIRQTLARGEQVLVFLNRRGYAPILLCRSCGYQADCARCSNHLTLHKSTLKKAAHANASYLYNHLKCHHCGYQIITPNNCPACHSVNLTSLGQGTSQLYERLHALFANPQNSTISYPIVQIDRDTVSTKGAWHKLYQTINTGKPMILVGTQMIAKGHHFPAVALVVVADADAGFLSPDFRSPEHTAQTIIQVAGRAGRINKTGKVLIQTYTPSNPLLKQLMDKGYHEFAQSLLGERKALGLPPFSHAVLIQAQAKTLDAAKTAITQAKAQLPFPHPFVVLAPIDAPMLKKNNLYHIQMLILAKQRKILHEVLNTWWHKVLALPSSKGVRLLIDVDPVRW